MHEIIGAIALVRREHDGEPQWLAHWNEESQTFDFIGGPRQPEESFRDCAIREFAFSLGLRPQKDFIASSGPRAHLEFRHCSPATGEETAYVVELFETHLFGTTARGTIEADPRIRWLSEREIRAGRSSNGAPVSDLAAAVFAKTDLASEW